MMEVLYYLVQVAFFLGSFIFLYALLNLHFDKRWKAYHLFIIIPFMVVFSIIFYISFYGGAWFKELHIYIAIIALCILLYKGDFWKKGFYIMLGYIIIQISTLLFSLFNNVLLQTVVIAEPVLLSMMLSRILIFVLGYYYIKKKQLDTANFTRKDWFSFSVVTLITILYFVYVNFITNEITQEDFYANLTIEYVLIFFMVLIYIMFYQLLALLTQKNIEITKTTLQLQSEDYNKKLHEEILAANEINRKLRHDMKHHLAIVESMIKEQPQSAISYIQDIYGHIGNVRTVQSENHILNYIVDAKMNKAMEEDIAFTVVLQDGLLFMEDFDIVTMFGNLLDNAIEANRGLMDKWIHLDIQTSNAEVMIVVENACDDKKLEMKGNRILTTKKSKENHGLGIENIEKCLKKYHGKLHLEKEDGTFKAKAIILIEKNK